MISMRTPANSYRRTLFPGLLQSEKNGNSSVARSPFGGESEMSARKSSSCSKVFCVSHAKRGAGRAPPSTTQLPVRSTRVRTGRARFAASASRSASRCAIHRSTVSRRHRAGRSQYDGGSSSGALVRLLAIVAGEIPSMRARPAMPMIWPSVLAGAESCSVLRFIVRTVCAKPWQHRASSVRIASHACTSG